MIKLPSVTLVSIDCHDPIATIMSMRYSMRQVEFAEAVIAMDASKHHEAGKLAADSGIRIVTRQQSDEKEMVGHTLNALDYEWDVLTLTPELFTTPRCLHQEWDARVLNTGAWDDEFLRYDYIGAPWPWPFPEPGWPERTENNCVGNGGFTMKSHQLCRKVKEIAESNPDAEGIKSNDRWVGRTIRPTLESMGFKYAPHEVAHRFSCEDEIYSGQFGYHGKYTKEMNGWKWDPHVQ